MFEISPTLTVVLANAAAISGAPAAVTATLALRVCRAASRSFCSRKRSGERVAGSGRGQGRVDCTAGESRIKLATARNESCIERSATHEGLS